MEIVGDQTPREVMRAADGDRERVADQLRAAHAEGRIDLAEFDERVQQAWAARTYGELEKLTADLPGAAARPPRPAARPQEQHAPAHHGSGYRAGVAAWLSASVINLVIWAIVSLSTMHLVYPWWIWVAGPWGALLLARWASERGRRAE
jgi:hypothetical protein